MQTKLGIENLQIAQETLKQAEKAVAEIKQRESQLEKEKEVLRREVNEFQMRLSQEQQKSKEMSEKMRSLEDREFALEERARAIESKEIEQQRRYNKMETQLKKYYEGIKKLEQKLRQKHQILVDKEKEIDEFEHNLEVQRHSLFQQVQNRLHELEIKETTMTKTMDVIRQREKELMSIKPNISPQKSFKSENGAIQLFKSSPQSNSFVPPISPISEQTTAKAYRPSATTKALFQTPKLYLNNETDTETETTQDFHAFRESFRKEPLFNKYISGDSLKKEISPKLPQSSSPVPISPANGDNFNLSTALGLSPESPKSFIKENLHSPIKGKLQTAPSQEVPLEGWIMDDTEFGGLVEQLELENAQPENTEIEEDIKFEMNEPDQQEMEIINSLKEQNNKLSEKIKKLKAELPNTRGEQANALKSALKEHGKTIESNNSLIEQLRFRT